MAESFILFHTLMKEPPRQKSRWTPWRVFWLTETVCLLSGLSFPFIPTKTGVYGGLPKALLNEPSYWEQAAVYFLATNVGAAVIILYELRSRRRPGRRRSPTTSGQDD